MASLHTVYCFYLDISWKSTYSSPGNGLASIVIQINDKLLALMNELMGRRACLPILQPAVALYLYTAESKHGSGRRPCVHPGVPGVPGVPANPWKLEAGSCLAMFLGGAGGRTGGRMGGLTREASAKAEENVKNLGQNSFLLGRARVKHLP
jgi:hypothetical protein